MNKININLHSSLNIGLLWLYDQHFMEFKHLLSLAIYLKENHITRITHTLTTICPTLFVETVKNDLICIINFSPFSFSFALHVSEDWEREERENERNRERHQRKPLSWSCCSKHDTCTKKKTVPALMRQGVLPSKAVFKAADACFICIVHQMNRLHAKCYKWLIKTRNRGFLNNSKKLKHHISAVLAWMVITNIYIISKGSVIFIHMCQMGKCQRCRRP